MYTKQIEEIENHCAPIKFINIEKEHIDSKNVKEFIENELFTKASLYNSIFVETGLFQCRSNADRSLGDIYALCKYYFPETTVIDVIKVIYNNILKFKSLSRSSILYFVGHYCGNINKRVYNHIDIKPHYMLCHDWRTDEYGLMRNDYFKICKEYENAELQNKSICQEH